MICEIVEVVCFVCIVGCEFYCLGFRLIMLLVSVGLYPNC